MTVLTKRNILAMDKREAFQDSNLILILSIIDWKWMALGLPLKMGAPRLKKGNLPIWNLNLEAIRVCL